MFYFRQALVHSDQHDVLNSTFYTDLGTAMIQDTLRLHAGPVFTTIILYRRPKPRTTELHLLHPRVESFLKNV